MMGSRPGGSQAKAGARASVGVEVGMGMGMPVERSPGIFGAAQAQRQRPVPDAQAMGRTDGSEVGHMEQAKLAQ